MFAVRSIFRLSVFLFLATPLNAQSRQVRPKIEARASHTFVHGAEGRDVAFTPDASLLLGASVDSTIKIWRVADGRMVRAIKNNEAFTAIAISPDGKTVVSGSYDGAVKLWRIADGSLIRILNGKGSVVWTVAFSPDGQLVATAGEDKLIKLWRVRDGVLLRTLKGHTLNVWSLAFAPDGQCLVSGSYDKTAKVWNVATGNLLITFTGHTQAVVGVAVSPDGKVAASSGDDSTVRFWRIADGKSIRTIVAGNHTYKLAFTPDGQWIAGASREYRGVREALANLTRRKLPGRHGVTTRIWRVSAGALQQSLAAHNDKVWHLDISRDGKWLATSSDDHTVKLWQLRYSRMPTPIVR
jgi:WD40 repeat protein